MRMSRDGHCCVVLRITDTKYLPHLLHNAKVLGNLLGDRCIDKKSLDIGRSIVKCLCKAELILVEQSTPLHQEVTGKLLQ